MGVVVVPQESSFKMSFGYMANGYSRDVDWLQRTSS